MTTFPNSPHLLKGGIVLIDLATGAVQRAIALQYNPDALVRTITVQTTGGNADRGAALRLNGLKVQTLKSESNETERSIRDHSCPPQS